MIKNNVARIIEYKEEYTCLNNINSINNKAVLNSQYMLEDQKYVYSGRHILFDLIGSSHSDKPEYIERIMKESIEIAGATILHKHFHNFGLNSGITGIFVLEESHASVHTWPETELMTFDIYMCGLCDPEISFEYIVEKLEPKEVHVMLCRRGIIKKIG